jgi:hypothetical protein
MTVAKVTYLRKLISSCYEVQLWRRLSQLVQHFLFPVGRRLLLCNPITYWFPSPATEPAMYTLLPARWHKSRATSGVRRASAGRARSKTATGSAKPPAPFSKCRQTLHRPLSWQNPPATPAASPRATYLGVSCSEQKTYARVNRPISRSCTLVRDSG